MSEMKSENGIRIRQAQIADLQEVVTLRGRCFKSSHWSTERERVDYMRRTFFENPWRTPGIDPLVAERAGTILAFIGLVPRHMRLGQTSVRGAVATQLMVSPEARGSGMGGLLIKAAFDSDQDVLITDVAQPAVERSWVANGGESMFMYKFIWRHRVAPFEGATASLGGSPPARVVKRGMRPALRMMDRVTRGLRYPVLQQYTAKPLDGEALTNDLATLIGDQVLHTTCDGAAMQWVLDQLAEKWGRTNLYCFRVCSHDGERIGVFLYVLQGGIAYLHLIVGESGKRGPLVDYLLAHAAQNGALVATGRFEPLMTEAYAERKLGFSIAGHGILVHVKDHNLLQHIMGGRALFTGLTGEWWMHF